MTAKPKRALFFVEGNIASGKSTVIKSLEAMGYTVVYEEVDDWKDRYQDVKGNNILGLFYKDMTKWSFAMQIGVIASRFNSLLQAIKRAPTDKPIIVERSLWTDVFVFAANLRLNGHINQIEWSIMIANYNLLFALIEPHLQEFKMRQIYIKTSPHICHQRQMERDRSEERALSDTPQYLVDLHEGHNQWLERENSLGYAAIVNGNQGVDANSVTFHMATGSIEEMAASAQMDFALFVNLANAVSFLPHGGHIAVLLPDRIALELFAAIPLTQAAPAIETASQVPLLSKTGIFLNSAFSQDNFEEAVSSLRKKHVEWVKLKTPFGYWIRIFSSQTTSYQGHEHGDLLLKDLQVAFNFDFGPTETTITAYRVGFPVFASVDEPM